MKKSKKRLSDEDIIYTDGSYATKKSQGGWGVVINPFSNNKQEVWSTVDNTTSNRMELMAVLYALEQSENSVIYTDSKYCADGYNFKIKNWEKNHWKKKKGRLRNADLWQRVFELKNKNKRVVWIPNKENIAHDLSRKYLTE